MDTPLSDFLCLKCLWADVAVGATPAHSIVIHFDALEDRLPDQLLRCKSRSVHRFHFQRVGKALRTAVVIAVAIAADAAP